MMYFNHFVVDKVSHRLEPYIRFLDAQQIVSVGSGTGRVEAKLMDLGWAHDIICVDPCPQSYDKREIVIAPQYSDVHELVEKSPGIVGNCSLLLVWSSPNDANYDVEAIKVLKPNRVMSVFDASGPAASFDFHLLMDKLDLPNQFNFGPKRPAGIEIVDEWVSYITTLTSAPAEDDLYIRAIVALHRPDIEPNCDLPTGEMNEDAASEDEEKEMYMLSLYRHNQCAIQ